VGGLVQLETKTGRVIELMLGVGVGDEFGESDGYCLEVCACDCSARAGSAECLDSSAVGVDVMTEN
jgi:hypothetical protein